MHKTLSLIALCLLAACSPQPNSPAASQPNNAAASSASAPTAASAAVWQQPPPAADAQGQARQLHDVISQFEHEAGQRVAAWRQTTMQPTLAQSIEMIRQESRAVRQDAEKLKQLSLSDAEVSQVRDLWVKKISLLADQADSQVQAADGKGQNQAIGQQADSSEQQAAAIEAADQAYVGLLDKYGLRR